MKLKIKIVTAFTLLSLFMASALTAQENDVKDRPDCVQKEVRGGDFKHPHPELQVLEGKIGILGKDDNRIVTLLTSDKKMYVLSTMNFPRFEKHHKKNISEKTDEKLPENQERKMPQGISMKELSDKKGQVISVKGILNKESNVFYVLEM